MAEPWQYETDQRGNRISIWVEDKQFAYITNLQHSQIREAYDQRCHQLGKKPWDSLNRRERVALDLELVERFGIDERTPFDVRRALTLPPYAGIKKAADRGRTLSAAEEDGNLSRGLSTTREV